MERLMPACGGGGVRFMEETAVKVTGSPRPSLGTLSSPMSPEHEITTHLLLLILQVPGSKMAFKSIQQTWAKE